MSQSAQAEIIGVFDSKFRQLFNTAVSMKTGVIEEATVFKHPLEDGVKVADHRIIEPVEIELQIFLRRGDYRDVYAQVRNVFHSDNVFIVQTRTSSYPNMTMQAMPHEEEPAMFDVVPMVLRFTEAQFVKTQFQALPPGKVRNKRDASTVKRGEQSSKGSILYGIFNDKPKKGATP